MKRAHAALFAFICMPVWANPMLASDGVYPIKYSTPGEIISKWNASASPLKGKVKFEADASTNSILLTGDKNDVSSIISELKKLDVEPISFDFKLQIVKVEKGKKDEIVQPLRMVTMDTKPGILKMLNQESTEGWIVDVTPSSINPEMVSVSVKFKKVGAPTLSAEIVRQVVPGQKIRVTGITSDSDPKVQDQVKQGKSVNTKNKSVIYYLDLVVQDSKNAN